MQQTTPLRIQRMERLLAVVRRLHQAGDLSSAFQDIVNAACELTHSETSSIMVFEEETGLLKFLAAPHHQPDNILRMRVPVETSIAGQVYVQGEPVIISDASLDPRVYRRVDEVTGFSTRSILAVPLIHRQQVIGVLEAINKVNDSPYTSDDADLLTLLAIQTASLIQDSRMQEQAERNLQDMEDLERMKANFIAITSHELRTPLGLVLGHATLLNDQITIESQRCQVQVIIDSALRLKKIVDDLAGMEELLKNRSKIRREPVNLKEIIQKTVQNLSGLAQRKKVRLLCSLPEEPLNLEGDRDKIYIALSNLVENGVQFSKEDGHVRVSAENLPGYTRVSVVDDGIGIPAREMHRVFERFFQVESHLTRRHSGLGMGLSVAKVMIELHGGQIWVESVEGKGSNFTFLLPRGVHGVQRRVSPFESEGAD